MMNPKEDEHAEKVWELTLPQIRRKRSQRDTRRKALVAAATACVACAAYLMSRSPAPDAPEQVVAPPPAGVAVVPGQTIAVIRVGSDGNAVLEEMSASKLSDGDMSFGLTQVVFEDPKELEANFRADSLIFQ
jgi:hypothetical protein